MCSTTERVDLLLPTDPRSAATAREFLRANGCPEHDLKVLDEALLLVSELVTNSVRYGGAPILLALECDEHTLTIRVRDGSPAAPAMRSEGRRTRAGAAWRWSTCSATPGGSIRSRTSTASARPSGSGSAAPPEVRLSLSAPSI